MARTFEDAVSRSLAISSSVQLSWGFINRDEVLTGWRLFTTAPCWELDIFWIMPCTMGEEAYGGSRRRAASASSDMKTINVDISMSNRDWLVVCQIKLMQSYGIAILSKRTMPALYVLERCVCSRNAGTVDGQQRGQTSQPKSKLKTLGAPFADWKCMFVHTSQQQQQLS